MKFYPREIIDCYLDKKYIELLNVPGADAVYVASVSHDLGKNEFYVERGVHYSGETQVGKIPTEMDKILEDCIKQYNSNKNNFTKIDYKINDKIPIDDIEKISCFKLQASTRERPLKSGIGIGNNFNKSGTLGAIVRCKNMEDTKFIISNHHVVFRSSEFVKDKLIFQPSPMYGGLDYCNIVAKTAYGGFNDYADVVFAEIINNQRGVTGNRVNQDRIKGIDEPRIGNDVLLTGAKTNLSESTIRSTNTYVKFRSPWKNEEFKIMKKQILTGHMSKDGDSGSLLIDRDSYKSVGLLIGGDNQTFSIFNSFKYIFNQNNDEMGDLEFYKFL